MLGRAMTRPTQTNHAPILFAPTGRRLQWGAKAGMAVALVLMLWAVGVYAFAGSAAFTSRGVSFWTTLVIYCVGGLLGGAVVGVMLPLVRWVLGAACVGMVATLPIGLVTMMVLKGAAPWGTVESVSVVLFVLLLGGPLGLTYRRIYLGEIREAERWRRRKKRKNLAGGDERGVST